MSQSKTQLNEAAQPRAPESGENLGAWLYPVTCPHCETTFTEQEIRSILGKFARRSTWAKEGPNRFKKMTPEQRSAEASKAAKARWAKKTA